MILPFRAFPVLDHLQGGGLPHVDKGDPLAVYTLNLCSRHQNFSPAARRRRRRHANSVNNVSMDGETGLGEPARGLVTVRPDRKVTCELAPGAALDTSPNFGSRREQPGSASAAERRGRTACNTRLARRRLAWTGSARGGSAACATCFPAGQEA